MADLEKTEEINELLDLYLPLLTEKQQTALQLVYQEDMSMQEAALLLGITKQTVHFNIQSGLKHIRKLEAHLHLRAKHKQLELLVHKYQQISAENFDLQELQSDLAELQMGN